MSKHAAREFFDSIKTDAELVVQFERATNPGDFSALAVRLGRDRGLAFTDKDVESLLMEAAGTGRTLSDDELESVAGGIGPGLSPIGTAACAKVLTVGCNTYNCNMWTASATCRL